MQNMIKTNLNFTANRMSYAQARYFDENLKKHKNADIICHESTDRDSVNSALVMSQYLTQMGVNTRIVLSGDLKALNIDEKKGNFIQSKDFVSPENNTDTTVLCVDFSSPSRIEENIRNYVNNSKNVYCMDHHKIREELDKDYFYLESSIDEIPEEAPKPYYIDASAKSATSVIYRFFEALGIKPTYEQNYEMMTGLVSDGGKKDQIKCDGETGEISASDKLKSDKNAYEVYAELRKNLKEEDVAKMAREVDITTNLTEDEKEFYQYLHKKMQLSPNKKIAYVELDAEDEIFQQVGGDNPRSSAIMNKFRKDVLKNKNNDDELNNVSCAMIFYKANDYYRISVHSKDDNILDYFTYLKNDCKMKSKYNFDVGGHQNRAGCKIDSLNPEICHKWVQDIVCNDEFFVK